MSVDRCVCCGEIIPEGRQVCPKCEVKNEPFTLNMDAAPRGGIRLFLWTYIRQLRLRR